MNSSLARLPLLFMLALSPFLKARVLVNQSGYNSGESKRFTAPLAAEGTPFELVSALPEAVVLSGTVSDGVGDFSVHQPTENGNYFIRMGSEHSHIFGIGPNWMERVSYRRMIQFFIDSRSGYGDATTWDLENGPFVTGIGWRDSHQFSFELRTLLQWYAANPDAFGIDRMPVEGTYPGLRHTLPEDTPEIVRLIHWGVDIYLRGEVNHTLLKEELAYFVYYYPLLSQWIPEELHQEAEDVLFSEWGNPARDRWNWHDVSHSADLFQTYTVMGGTKGPLPPGHSIIPNLLMADVAVRENRSNSQAFLTAARNQVQWIVDNLDPADPMVTKGQRMSEHILVPSLVEFVQRDGDGPVTGVTEWVRDWADTMVARSDNFWDFRRFSDAEWTPGGWSQGYWNEPGNVAGLPASLYAAIDLLDDDAVIQRLRVIAVSHLDHVFGRNPFNRHFSFRAAQPTHGFEGVERGWFSQHSGGYGDLGDVRGVLDASPKHPAYPYDPGAHPGYVEGWVAFNTAWNAAMTWAARDRTRLEFIGPDGQPAGTPVGADGFLRLRLRAPLNFDADRYETATVTLASDSGDREELTLIETRPGSSVFTGAFRMESVAVALGDQTLQAAPGESVTAAYGHDVFATTATAVAAAVADPGPTQSRVAAPALPAGQAGRAYERRLTLVGGRGPATWTSGAGTVLPEGLALTASGILRGVPESAGDFVLETLATDGTGATASATLPLLILPEEVAILDAGGPGTHLTGSWNVSTFEDGYHGTDYLQDGDTGQGQKSVDYVFSGLVPGRYALAATWTPGNNRADRVPVRIETSAGTGWVFLNQKTDPQTWNPLTEVVVPADGAVTVTVTNTGANGYVIADAFRLSLLHESPLATYDRWAQTHLPEGSRDPGDQVEGVPALLKYYIGDDPVTSPLRLVDGTTAGIFINDSLPGIRVSLMGGVDLRENDWVEILGPDTLRAYPSDETGRRMINLEDSGQRFFRLQYGW